VLKVWATTGATIADRWRYAPRVDSLRIYECDGDCVALRESGRTSVIFDTGTGDSFRRGTTRSACAGFGLALYEAVGAPSRHRARPIVVISHVDADHLGGLNAWVGHTLAQSATWADARARATREVRTVVCNVPPEHVFFRHLFGLDDGRGAGDSGAPSTRPEALFRDSERWAAFRSQMDVYVRREALARRALLGDAAPPVARTDLEDEDRRTVEVWCRAVAAALQDAFERAGRITDEFPLPGPIEAEAEHAGVLSIDAETRNATLTYENVRHELGAIDGEATSRLLGAGRFELRVPMRRVDVAQILNASSLPEAVFSVASMCTRQSRSSPPLAASAAHAIGMLGLTRASDLQNELSLFRALALLGLPPQWCFHPGHSPLEDAVVLSPGWTELRELFARERVFERWRIALPDFATAWLATLATFRFSMDGSPTNLSSIALAFPESEQRRLSCILTGDGLHSTVVKRLRGILARNPRDLAIGRRCLFQIPHHGGRRNTDPATDVLPYVALALPGRIAASFASGGNRTVDAPRKRGPRSEILRYHATGARRVIAVRQLADQDEVVELSENGVRRHRR
jgi:hypothetical protein